MPLGCSCFASELGQLLKCEWTGAAEKGAPKGASVGLSLSNSELALPEGLNTSHLSSRLITHLFTDSAFGPSGTLRWVTPEPPVEWGWGGWARTFVLPVERVTTDWRLTPSAVCSHPFLRMAVRLRNTGMTWGVGRADLSLAAS